MLMGGPIERSCAGRWGSPNTSPPSTTFWSLINLALLCGHVGRYGSGLNPLRGQNNVQGGGDMGAIPNKLPGFQDIQGRPRRPGEVRGSLGRQAATEARLAPL